MFQFRRFPTHTYLIQYALPEVCSGGFPHSDIPGSQLICSSPRLFAAYHVLRRLLMPRHSPCALIRLTFVRRNFISFASAVKLTLLVESSLIPFFFLSKFDPLRWARIWLVGFTYLQALQKNPFLVSLQSFKNYAGSISFLLAEIVFQLP